MGKQTSVHNQYPGVDAFGTEHSGGTWIANQQREDMLNIVDYTRNWAKSVTKWSLAVDPEPGAAERGVGTCSGLITVHNGDGASGRSTTQSSTIHDGAVDEVRAAGGAAGGVYGEYVRAERGVAQS